MAELPIKTLKVQNYGPIQDIELELSPLHALIGPNDVGKSWLLRALRTVAQFGGSRFAFPTSKPRPIEPFDPRLEPSRASAFAVSFSDGQSYSLAWDGSDIWESTDDEPKPIQRNGWNSAGMLHARTGKAGLRDRLNGSLFLKVIPELLRGESPLIPTNSAIVLDDGGARLAGVYDAMMVRNIDAFVAVRDKAVDLFPALKQIGMENTSTHLKRLRFQLRDDTWISADDVSDGLLYYLAFAALPHLSGASLVLVEEPENGLHPARIAVVIEMLRELSKQAQVVLTTHSPLVVNELAAHEVTVVTRSAETGTQGKLLKDVPKYERRSEVYANGELWLAYGNAEDEGPLLSGGPRP